MWALDALAKATRLPFSSASDRIVEPLGSRMPEPEPPAEDEEPAPEEPEPQTPANCTTRAVDVRYASAEGLDACNELAGQYSVATGELFYATANDDCYSMDLVCVPEACQLLRVSAGDTWYVVRAA